MQYTVKMKRKNKYLQFTGILITLVFLASCSSVNNLPGDEVYYSKKAKNPSEYNWNDFQKNAQTYSSGNVKADHGEGQVHEGTVSGGGASGDIATTVEGADADQDNQYIDEYYDQDYSSKINHFSDEGTSSGFGYYDGYYGGSGSSFGMSNWSMGLGFGYGYGSPWGYSMGYGYGWPSYGMGYGAGYNAGYWNGYWNGYYGGMGYPCGYCGYGGYGGYYGYGGYGGYYGGGGYYPGNYPDYTTPSVVYGPRGTVGAGTTIPKSRGQKPSSGNDNSGKSTPANGGRGTIVAAPVTADRASGGGTSGNTSTTERLSKPVEEKTVVTSADKNYYKTRPVSTTVGQDNVARPANRQQAQKQQQATPRKKYAKPVSEQTRSLPEPKYQKPKSYESLPSRKPQSRQEYVRPVNRIPKSSTRNYNPYTRTKQVSPSSTRNYINTNNNRRGNYSPAKSTSSPSRSYSSPSRSGSPSRSYSSPSRSYSSPSRSYSSPSRSSGSSTSHGGGGGSVSRSSSSGSSSRGGGKR